MRRLLRAYAWTVVHCVVQMEQIMFYSVAQYVHVCNTCTHCAHVLDTYILNTYVLTSEYLLLQLGRHWKREFLDCILLDGGPDWLSVLDLLVYW